MNNQPKRPVRKTTRRPQGSNDGNFSLFAAIIIAVLALVNYKIFSSIITDNPTPIIINNNVTQTQTEEEPVDPFQEELARDFTTVTVSNGDTKSGNLVLVNNTHAFDFDAVPLAVQKQEPVSIGSYKNNNYYVSYNTETLTLEAIEAFNKLTEDFVAQTGHRDLIILDSIRTVEDQQRILEGKGTEIATNPGCSEHHTGLAFDLSLYINGIINDFDGTGDYEWILNNCHKYGYILRYPADKTEITGITYEPWHLRYVGKVHACFMKQNNICLEEYIDLLSRFPIKSSRLQFSTFDGEQYMIYSQPVSGNTAAVYVPKNYEYTLSGDNDGRVIVTCKIS